MNIESWKITSNCGALIKEQHNEYGKWLDGIVATPYGYVTVYSEHDTSNFRFIHQGRCYSASIEKSLTARGLTTVAGKFVKSVIEGAIAA